MFRAFWILLFLVTALASHAAYVLFFPSQNFVAGTERLLGANAVNRFAVVPPDVAQKLLPVAGPSDLVGICRYDLAGGPIILESRLPRLSWVFLIYTASGRQAYTLTDVQAGETAFTVELGLQPDLIGQVMSIFVDNAEEAENISNAGWRVKVAEPQGMALIWMPLADPVFRPQAEAILKGTRCRQKPAGALVP